MSSHTFCSFQKSFKRIVLHACIGLLLIACAGTEAEQEPGPNPPTNSAAKKVFRVAVQPYGGFPPAEVQQVSEALTSMLGAQVLILPNRPLPESAFIHVKTPRYRADSLLADLKRSKAPHVYCVLGLSQKDISATKRGKDGQVKQPEFKYRDWGVFGLGYMPGAACVVSTFRLPKGKPSYMMRLKKISVHELGHNLGLPHCPMEGCVMMDAAETIKTIDRVKLAFCEKCWNAVQTKLKKEGFETALGGSTEN